MFSKISWKKINNVQVHEFNLASSSMLIQDLRLSKIYMQNHARCTFSKIYQNLHLSTINSSNFLDFGRFTLKYHFLAKNRYL